MDEQQHDRLRRAGEWTGLVEEPGRRRSTWRTAVDLLCGFVVVGFSWWSTRGESLWLRALVTLATIVVVSLVVAGLQEAVARRRR